MRNIIKSIAIMSALLLALVCTSNASFTRSLTTGLTTALTQGLTQLDGIVDAAWVLDLLGLGQGNGSTSTTNNATVGVYLDGDTPTDGQTIVGLGSTVIGIQNGCQLGTTSSTGGRLGADVITTPFTASESPPNSTVIIDGSDDRIATLTTDGTLVILIDSLTITPGLKYVFDYNTIAHSGTDFTSADMGGATLDTSIGNHTMDFESTATAFQVKRVAGAGMLKLRVNSVKEVIPQYSFDTNAGDSLALYEDLATDNGGIVRTLVQMNDWEAAATVVAGDIARVSTTEGIPCHIEYATGGTSAGSQPTVSISDIGGSAIVDGGDGATFLVLGFQTVEGLFSGLSQAQFLASPDVPANQTTASLGTGTYILFMNGTGSVSATDNTATSDAAGQSADEDNPLVITVTGAGTIDIAITGTVDIFNLQDSPVETPYILTSPRTATVTSEPTPAGLTANDFSLQVSFDASVVGTLQWLFSDGTAGIFLDASNNVNFTDGVNTATGSAVIAVDSTNTILVDKSSDDGVTITTNEVVDATEAGQTSDITWGSTIYTGSKGAALQLSGNTIGARVL